MSQSKVELTTKPKENSNQEQMKDQIFLNELPTGIKTNGPKPKTKICDHWRRSGTCSYGDACWYAHGEDDLRKVNIPRRTMEVGGEDYSEKYLKNPDEARTTKRSSTNVKGLTVNIPSSIAFKEQVSNAAMPLSPAQERWISMSVGAVPPAAMPDKSADSVLSSSSTITMRGEVENDLEREMSMESLFDRRSNVPHVRDEDMDDYGFLSPNPFPYPQQNTAFNRLSAHQQPFNRGTSQKHMQPQFGGQIPASHHQVRSSRSGSNMYGSQYLPRSSSTVRSSREHLPMSGAPQPQFQQAIWNVAGEIYQRQKDVESAGMRGAHDQQKGYDESIEMGRILARIAKMKDPHSLRYLLNQSSNDRPISRDAWNDLIGNDAPYNQTAHNTHSRHNEFHGNYASDCLCGMSRPKIPTDQSSFFHTHYSHHHPHHAPQQQPFYPQQHHQYYRRHAHHGHPNSATELSAKPKVAESVLPADDTFSIWLDRKPKRETGSYIRAAENHIEPSESGTSLLTKMDALREEKFPLAEEDLRIPGAPIERASSDGRSEKRSSSESSSPAVLSLMELLSSENLLEQSNEKSKTTMFDFDTLKIAETLGTGQSSQTSKSGSPLLFLIDDKTPGFDEPCSSLFTPCSAKTPQFTELCDFFAAGGTCPFGDGCHLSHSIPADDNGLHAY